MTDPERVEMLVKENERLEKVMKLTPNECLAAGYVMGMAFRDKPHILDDKDREMLKVAGHCLGRIINRLEAEDEIST